MVKGDRSVDSMATARALFEDLQLEPFAELGPSGSGWRHRGAAARAGSQEEPPDTRLLVDYDSR